MLSVIIAVIVGAAFGVSGAVVYDKRQKSNSKNKIDKRII